MKICGNIMAKDVECDKHTAVADCISHFPFPQVVLLPRPGVCVCVWDYLQSPVSSGLRENLFTASYKNIILMHLFADYPHFFLDLFQLISCIMIVCLS